MDDLAVKHDPMLQQDVTYGDCVVGTIHGGGNPHYTVGVSREFVEFVIHGHGHVVVGDRKFTRDEFLREIGKHTEHIYTIPEKQTFPGYDY